MSAVVSKQPLFDIQKQLLLGSPEPPNTSGFFRRNRNPRAIASDAGAVVTEYGYGS